MAEVTMGFGVTGSRKTTAVGAAAEYLYEVTGLPTRAIYSDGGGWKTIKDRVEAGFIEPYNIQDEPDMPMLLHKLSKGYWPRTLVDGIRPPGTKLVKTPDLGRVIGGYIWEGATTSAELLMKYLREKQIAISGEPVGKFSIQAANCEYLEPGEVNGLYCANNMKHYDWVQTETIGVIGEFASLPVRSVFITAHEAAGTDEETRDPIRGPALVGKAGTAKVGRNVGDLLHFDRVPVMVGNKMEVQYRVYFQSHPDPKFPNTAYDCKSRLPEEQAKALLKEFPLGYFEPSEFTKYLRVTDSLIAAGTVSAKQRKAAFDLRQAITQKETK